jgi:glucose/arabinose dehydrogenase
MERFVVASLPLLLALSALSACFADDTSVGGDAGAGVDAAADATVPADATLTDRGGPAAPDARDGATPDARDASVTLDAAADEGGMERPPSCGDGIPPLKVTPIPAPDLALPSAVAFPPGDPTRVILVELGGLVRLLKGGVTTPFLDLHTELATGGERGLLGFAFHPGYAQNGRFFVAYTKAITGDFVVQEYRRSAASADEADPTPVGAPLLVQAHPAPNHNGGMLAFGPDGYLYIGMGDGGGGGDSDPTYPHAPEGNGQSLATRQGKILRIDVDTRAAPAGNMTGPGVEPLIWDYGLRNPWRFSFDRATGDMYIGDVGQGIYEEIDFEPRATGHWNYGWVVMEGNHCYSASTCDAAGLRPPIAERVHPSAFAIIGGYVYRGAKIPCLRGRYVYGDYITRRFWTLTYEGDAAKLDIELTSDLDPAGAADLDVSAFGEDEAGELYFVTLNGGRFYRIDPE